MSLVGQEAGVDMEQCKWHTQELGGARKAKAGIPAMGMSTGLPVEED